MLETPSVIHRPQADLLEAPHTQLFIYPNHFLLLLCPTQNGAPGPATGPQSRARTENLGQGEATGLERGRSFGASEALPGKCSCFGKGSAAAILRQGLAFILLSQECPLEAVLPQDLENTSGRLIRG